MALEVDTARLATYRAAWGVDQGRDNLKELSMAKYLATEAGTQLRRQGDPGARRLGLHG